MVIKEQFRNVPDPTVRRLPTYLNYLYSIRDDDMIYIPSAVIAEALNLTGIQVRKDLAWISDSGKPRTGFHVKRLIRDIRYFLGYEEDKKAVLIGTGHLGNALLNYRAFVDYRLEIVCAFDNDPALIGQKIGEVQVYDIKDYAKVCEALSIENPIVLLAVPEESAQDVVDMLVSGPCRAIWNFAPGVINVPDGMIIEQLDLARSLGILWRRVANAEPEDDDPMEDPFFFTVRSRGKVDNAHNLGARISSPRRRDR